MQGQGHLLFLTGSLYTLLDTLAPTKLERAPRRSCCGAQRPPPQEGFEDKGDFGLRPGPLSSGTKALVSSCALVNGGEVASINITGLGRGQIGRSWDAEQGPGPVQAWRDDSSTGAERVGLGTHHPRTGLHRLGWSPERRSPCRECLVVAELSGQKGGIQTARGPSPPP